MPKIAIYKYLTFYIFSFDAVNEPPHLHVAKEKGNRQRSAKIWLESLMVADKGTLTEKEINEAVRLMKKYQQELISSFNNAKMGLRITTLNLK